ncbi:GumC family protein [Bacterioplanoides sp.]|uniref:GumC family protein n=1 Tax=Bacterioplanoides sp. TaxID=2066072 RepID=UPI003B00A56E
MTYEEEDQAIEIPANFIAALSRYKVHLMISVVLLGILSVIMVMLIPAVYRSESIVLVETQQIPDDLVRSTVTSIAAERIQIIKQRVMTREKLLDIANKHPSVKEDAGNLLVSELVQSMRGKISVELITSNKNNSRSPATTIAFKVGFDALNPVVAQSVANDLVTLFLNENVQARTERASETTEFLRAEADKIKVRLADTEQAIADYKQKNKEALPEHLDLYISMLDRAQLSRIEIQRQIEVESNQRSLYELQANGYGSLKESDELEALHSEYKSLSAVYKDSHPDIKALKKRISILEGRSSQPVGDGLVDTKLKSSAAQLNLLKQQLEKNKIQIEDLEEKIIQIPQVERGLISLNRDYEVVKEQYDRVVSNTMQAQMAESLEQGRKAERFSILEPPLLPDQPYKPRRKVLLAAGVGLSLFMPLGVILLIALTDKSVRGVAALERITGSAPLVVVGVINTGKVEKKKKKNQIRILMIVAGLCFLGVLLVHFFVIPLDSLVYKLMYKAGLA